MSVSSDSPKCPAMIPIKNTKVTPKETPHTLIFPRAKPIAHIIDKTITACSALYSTKIELNHSIHQHLIFSGAKVEKNAQSAI